MRPALSAAVRDWRAAYDGMMAEDVRRESNYVKSASGGSRGGVQGPADGALSHGLYL